MKRTILLFTFAAVTTLIFSSYGSGPAAGGAGNHTGSAGSPANCTGSGCHVSNNSATIVSITLTTQADQPVSSYTAGTTYKLNIRGTNSNGLGHFGFQASSVRATATSTQAGTITATNSYTDVVTLSGIQLIEHTTPLTATSVSGGTGTFEASCNWTAPGSGTGTVRFYASLNAVNYNGTESGDQPNTATPLDIAEGTTLVGSKPPVLYTLYPNPASDLVHLKSIGRIEDVRVTDQTGKTVRVPVSIDNTSEASLDVSMLHAGYYHVILTDGERTGKVPFVKN